jgi:hypothetical protein
MGIPRAPRRQRGTREAAQAVKPIVDFQRVFLDTAPVIYFVEKSERYLDAVRPIFDRIDQGLLAAELDVILLDDWTASEHGTLTSWSHGILPGRPPNPG